MEEIDEQQAEEERAMEAEEEEATADDLFPLYKTDRIEYMHN